MSEETTNPVAQFAEVVLTAIMQMNANNLSFAQAVSLAFDDDPIYLKQYPSPREQAKSLFTLMQLSNAAASFISQNVRERSRSGLNERLGELSRLLIECYPSINFSSADSIAKLTRSAQEVLMIGDSLSGLDVQRQVKGEEVEEIIKMIDDMMAYIMDSSLDTRMKSRIIRALGTLRTSVLSAKFIPVDAIIADMDAVIGAGVRAMAGAATEEQKKDASTFLERAAETSDNLGKVIEFSQKYLTPLAPIATQVVKALGGG